MKCARKWMSIQCYVNINYYYYFSARKNMFTDLGFGDFYNELAVKLIILLVIKLKIIDICNKKKIVNGGMMKISDIIYDFRTLYKM